MTIAKQVTAIYVARKSMYGQCVTQFLRSLGETDDVNRLSLIIVNKGRNAVSEEHQKMFPDKCHTRIIELDDKAYDWGAYMYAVDHVSTEYVVLFNTQTEIMHSSWLKVMLATVSQSNVAMVGGTASWGTWNFEFSRYFKAYKANVITQLSFVKGFVSSAFNPYALQFPSPHLRSNGILLKTTYLRAYLKAMTPPRFKLQTHFIENGCRSLNVFIKNNYGDIVVVDSDGRSYQECRFLESKTFRHPLSTGALFSDKQTRAYMKADRALRRRLEWGAWGTILS